MDVGEFSNLYKHSDDKSGAGSSNTPLFDLVSRLINDENKQNTIVTDAQIMHILQLEFDIDITNLHILEGEIYSTVIKTFLRDWPEWDKFHKKIDDLKNELQIKRNYVFNKYYTNLKKYLKSALDIAIPMAKKSVKDLTRQLGENLKSNEKSGKDVVLEIEASREQLNNLIIRHPAADSMIKSIFNVSAIEPTQITIFTPSLQSILNWWGVNMSIYCTQLANGCVYRRESKHELSHVLVNKKLLINSTPQKILNQQLKFKMNFKGSKNISEVETCDVLEGFKHICELYSESVQNIHELFDFIQKDFSLLPPKIIIPSVYKRYTNKYPYVRYLYKDVKGNNVLEDDRKKYDIQLQETISPLYELYIGTIESFQSNSIDLSTIKYPIVVQCSVCAVVFKGPELISDLKTHFSNVHQHEIDFKCTNCDQEFAVETLSQNWWCHKC